MVNSEKEKKEFTMPNIDIIEASLEDLVVCSTGATEDDEINEYNEF